MLEHPTLLKALPIKIELISWNSIIEKLQQILPVSPLWILLSLVCSALLFLTKVASQIAGILKWLNVKSPFDEIPSIEEVERSRRKLLRVIDRDADSRLAKSIHESVTIELHIETQSQQVEKPNLELIEEDQPSNIEGGIESFYSQSWAKEKLAKFSVLSQTWPLFRHGENLVSKDY